MSLASPATWTVTAVSVDHPDSVTVLRAYMDELISRYYGRPAEEEEIAKMTADNADLLDGRGIFLLARAGAAPVACIGIRWFGPGTGELTRVFVTRDARRGGAGRRLVGAAEDAARERSATRILLNTRKDLTEAIALYTALGYRPTDPYGDDPYAELWLAKDLG